MVNERMHALGAEPSAIRELFAYGMARKAEIGDENVFDFSIGNPSVPAPEAVKRAVLELMEDAGMRQEMALYAIESSKRFSWGAIAEKWQALLEELGSL